MTDAQLRWQFFKIGAWAVGLIATASWVALAILMALGVAGVFGAFTVLPLTIATIGLFLVFSFLWQTAALVRIGLLLEKIREGLEKKP